MLSSFLGGNGAKCRINDKIMQYLAMSFTAYDTGEHFLQISFSFSI